MDDRDLAARLTALEQELSRLRAELTNRDTRLRDLEDIEAIKRLQCAYGYYLEHAMTDEIIDCFSTSPEVSANFAEGTYLGPEGIRRHFEQSRNMPNSYLHMVLQVSPVITLDGDGMRAKGRWYGYGDIMFAPTEPLDPSHIALIYEMEYVKENGDWKILTMKQNLIFLYRNGTGQPATQTGEKPIRPPVRQRPDLPAEYDTEYPSGYIFPMHYPHPVTGRPSTENEHNGTLTLGPSKRRPA